MVFGLGSDLTFAYIDRTAWLTVAIALTGVVSPAPSQPKPVRSAACLPSASAHAQTHCSTATVLDAKLIPMGAFLFVAVHIIRCDSAGYGSGCLRRLRTPLSHCRDRWYAPQLRCSLVFNTLTIQNRLKIAFGHG